MNSSSVIVWKSVNSSSVIEWDILHKEVAITPCVS